MHTLDYGGNYWQTHELPVSGQHLGYANLAGISASLVSLEEQHAINKKENHANKVTFTAKVMLI